MVDQDYDEEDEEEDMDAEAVGIAVQRFIDKVLCERAAFVKVSVNFFAMAARSHIYDTVDFPAIEALSMVPFW